MATGVGLLACILGFLGRLSLQNLLLQLIDMWDLPVIRAGCGYGAPLPAVGPDIYMFGLPPSDDGGMHVVQVLSTLSSSHAAAVTVGYNFFSLLKFCNAVCLLWFSKT